LKKPATGCDEFGNL